MLLTGISLENFRNYVAADLDLDPDLTIVAGPNGAGKTNLLEAVWVTATGRSPRTARDHELVRRGASFARVRLALASPAIGSSRVELVVPADGAASDLHKRLLLNGVSRRVGALADHFRVVMFRPEEMLLLVGSPADRRRMMDSILSQTSVQGARDLADLARVVGQRNALLRAVRAEEADATELAFWDEQLAGIGARVMAARLRLVDALRARIGPLHEAVAPAEERGERVDLAYRDTLKDAWPGRERGGAEAAELAEALRRRLGEIRQKEIWNAASLAGPQRDDLEVRLGGTPVAEHASRGQQRTIILALKLAEADVLADGQAGDPVVLLDDVFSELDPRRAERALDLLRQRGQVIVTVADAGLLPRRHRHRVPIWSVEAGQLSPVARVA